VSLKRALVNVLLIAALLAVVAGCSSDEEDSDDILNDNEPQLRSGIFLDSEVGGLTYQSGNGEKWMTSQDGVFEYTPGQPITFWLGGAELGTLPDGKDIITPNDFEVPENIARFIQTFDSDEDPSNGIDLFGTASMLDGFPIPSSVFEIENANDFENHPLIVQAMNMMGRDLIGADEANQNLENGTDDTFETEELSNELFIFNIPSEYIDGFVRFDAPSGQGSLGTGYGVGTDETTYEGESGNPEGFTWSVNAQGVMTMNHSDGSMLEFHRRGGSSRTISLVITEEDDAETEALTLIRPIETTETDVCGDTISESGVASKRYRIHGEGREMDVTFNANGTHRTVEDNNHVIEGYWGLDPAYPNVVFLSNGHSPLVPGSEWRFFALSGGNWDGYAQILMADVTFNGFNGGDGSEDFQWHVIAPLFLDPR